VTPKASVALTLLILGLLSTPTTAVAQEETPSIDVAALLGQPAGSPAEGEELTRRTLEVGSLMRCPVCQGLPISDSPSASAITMLSQVRDLLAEGYTQSQILDYFERSYGEFVLLQPKAKGFNLLVWLAPVLVIALGLYLIRRRLAVASDSSPSHDPDLDEYLQRVRSEVDS